MDTPIQVTDLAHLRKLVEDGHHEFHIRLNGPLISRKEIWLLTDGSFEIHNCNDDSTQTLTDIGIMNGNKFTNIGPAIELGAFYCED